MPLDAALRSPATRWQISDGDPTVECRKQAAGAARRLLLLEDGEGDEDAVPEHQQDRGERLSTPDEVGEPEDERQNGNRPEDQRPTPWASSGIRLSHGGVV